MDSPDTWLLLVDGSGASRIVRVPPSHPPIFRAPKLRENRSFVLRDVPSRADSIFQAIDFEDTGLNCSLAADITRGHRETIIKLYRQKGIIPFSAIHQRPINGADDKAVDMAATELLRLAEDLRGRHGFIALGAE